MGTPAARSASTASDVCPTAHRLSPRLVNEPSSAWPVLISATSWSIFCCKSAGVTSARAVRAAPGGANWAATSSQSSKPNLLRAFAIITTAPARNERF